MFDFIKNIFKYQPKLKTRYNKKYQQKQPSSVSYNGMQRILNIKDTDCGLIMHQNDKCQVIFTKFKNQQKNSFTQNQELLMALTMFLKQKGFGEMLINQFHRLASDHKMFQQDNENKEK